jgi:ribonuclease III
MPRKPRGEARLRIDDPAPDSAPSAVGFPDERSEAGEHPPADNAERLAATLGLAFRNLDLLRLALTHRSVVHDWAEAMPDAPLPPINRRSNERLEFLGDAVLGYVVADELYRRFPEAPEGVLTPKRAAVVRAEQLVRWAREIELADYLYLGQGERVTEGTRDRMLAGAFEAIIGAIALDRGLTEARRFVRRFLRRDEARIVAELVDANPKGRLQELIQEQHRAPPVYQTLHEEGPDHAKTFTVEVSISGQRLGIGTGVSKREAEQAAAATALAALAIRDVEDGATRPGIGKRARQRAARTAQPEHDDA